MTATVRWRTARRSTTRRPSSSAEKMRPPLEPRFAQSSRRRAGRHAKPALAMVASACFAVEVLGLEDPGGSARLRLRPRLIAAVFQPPSAFERPFPSRVPYLRDKT